MVASCFKTGISNDNLTPPIKKLKRGKIKIKPIDINKTGVCLPSVSCNFFEVKQQVFECVKSHIDGQIVGDIEQPTRYFHFNGKRLDVSIGPIGIGLSGYECEKNEFVFTCTDLKKDNFDDQITLDRYTLAAQQIIRSSKKTAIIDYSCKELNRLVE